MSFALMTFKPLTFVLKTFEAIPFVLLTFEQMTFVRMMLEQIRVIVVFMSFCFNVPMTIFLFIVHLFIHPFFWVFLGTATIKILIWLSLFAFWFASCNLPSVAHLFLFVCSYCLLSLLACQLEWRYLTLFQSAFLFFCLCLSLHILTVCAFKCSSGIDAPKPLSSCQKAVPSIQQQFENGWNRASACDG